MDCEENDQGKDLQLASEGRAKFPPALRPYAIPKFDFDDNLQGHLRFDNLVETEVFLGIESQEGNHWIEDFSRGNPGIEFSSTAAESVSISRCNNVWSEATSSESVEMLLKSVGQEEMIPEQATVEELDACDELGVSIKQANTSFEQDPTLQSDELLEDFPGLNEDALKIRDSTQSQGGDTCLETNVICVKQDTLLTDQGNIMVREEIKTEGTSCSQPNKTEIGISSDEITESKIKDDALSPIMGVDINKITAVQNIRPSIDELSQENIPQETDTSNIISCDVEQETDDGKKELQVSENKEQVGENQSRVRDALESCINDFEKITSVSKKNCIELDAVGSSVSRDKSDTSVAECFHGDTVNCAVSDTEAFALPEDKKTGDYFQGGGEDNPPISLRDDNSCQENSEACNSVSDNAANIELKTDPVASILELQGIANEGELSLTVEQVENVKPEAALLLAEDDKLCGEPHDTITDMIVGDIPRAKVVSSSVELPSGTHMSEDVHGVLDTNRVSEEVLTDPAAVSSSFKTTTVSKDSNVCDGQADVLLIETQNLELTAHSIDMGRTDGSTISHTVESSASEERSEIVGISAAEDTAGIPFPPGDGLPRHDISEELKDDVDQTVGDCSAADKNHCIVSDYGGNAPGTVEQQSQAADQSLVMESCTIATQCSTQGPREKFNQKTSRDSEVPLVLSDATAGEENIHEHVAVGHHQGVILGNAVEAPSTLAENIAIIDAVSESDVRSHALESGIRSMDSDDISEDKEEHLDKKQEDAIVPPLDVNASDTHKMCTDSKDPKVRGISEAGGKTTLEDSPLLDTNKVAESSSVSRSSQKESRLAQKTVKGSAQALETENVQSGSKSTERKTRRPSNRSTGKESSKKGSHGKETTPTKPLERVEKSSNILPTVGSSLPDLNSSSSLTVMFQQPFTDLQQLQLRAQIFVYGSLIQGTTPDEACMISAFGGTDGGRSIWGNAWRVSLERRRAQRPQSSSTLKTPMQQRSVSDSGNKLAGAHSKVVASPLGRTSKGSPLPVSSPIIPVSSPLWTMNTPSHTAQQSSGMPRGLSMDHNMLPPLHPHQTPPASNIIGRSPPWTSVPTFPISWGSSPQPVFDTSARFSAKPIMEPVNLTPVRESSVPQFSGTNHVSPSSIIHTVAPTGSYAANSPAIDVKNTVSTPGQASTESKSRKRKKVSAPDDLTLTPLVSQARPQPVSAPYISNILSSSVVVTTPALISKDDTMKTKVGDMKVDKRVTLSEDTIGKVREAKLEAEDAASLAAASVDYSQSIWNQLNQQRISGLLPDVEAKLASAAAAVAAAASVAKAAAAAAKVASDAALQAKLMAEEALASNDLSNPVLTNVLPTLDGFSTLGNATPASILKGEDRSNNSGSFIVAAREAARRKIEAASAASKRAENLDAIVKAAELVAQAVTQAGKVVAMGDPLPLGELLEAGPDGYWKLPQVSSDQAPKLNLLMENSILNSLTDGANTSSKLYEGGTSDQQAQVTDHGKLPTPQETPLESTDDHTRLIDLISGSSAKGEKIASGNKGHKASGLTENSIKEGSLVEVLKRDDASQAAWFSAHVLELNDDKAYVSYTEIPSSEGSGQLKEWITLGTDDDEDPVLRLPHPTTTVQFEGTRKRRRAAMSNYAWSVGDRVDAWMHNCWREGVISEKNAKDDNSLSVLFPAQRKTSLVKAWHLRPSLTWKDGQWVEWSGSSGNDFSAHEGDTPREKRLKLGSPRLEAKKKTVTSKTIDDVELLLPEIEGTFNVGKSTRDGNKTDSRRVMRTGLQKEGSKVVFGIPKPGKKRKFMDVSKHYVTEGSSKPNEAVDSVKDKSSKGPQGLGLRGWKTSTKVDFRDKPGTESKSRVPKSGKPHSVSTRSIPPKDNRVNKGSVEEATDGTFVFSSSARSDDRVSSKSSTSNSRATKGKLGPSGNLSKIEEEKVYNGNSGRSGEAVEPRRSIRRIQPTSRLLEGIQSSLSISKIPSVSHDKGGHKNLNKGN